jgi:hypothetical protein
MTPHQVIAVAVRLFAVWLGISVVEAAPVLYLGQYGFQSRPLAAIIAVLVAGVVIFLLWFFPQALARRLLSPSAGESPPSATPDLWLAMGCALIGLWFLSSTVPAIIRYALILTAWSGGADDITSVKHWLVYDSVAAAIGIWLVLGGKGFRKVFWWAQTAGY